MDKGMVRLEPSTNRSQKVFKMAGIWLLISSFVSHCKWQKTDYVLQVD